MIRREDRIHRLERTPDGGVRVVEDTPRFVEEWSHEWFRPRKSAPLRCWNCGVLYGSKEGAGECPGPGPSFEPGTPDRTAVIRLG